MSNDLGFHKDRAALVIVDMQNAFLDKKGSLSVMGLDTSRTRTVIEPIQKLRELFSSARRPVIHLQHTHRVDGLDAGLIDKVFPPIMNLGHCKAGTWDWQIIPELAPRPGEVVVEKYRFSGFFNTQLENVLKQLGVEVLVVCGVATNVCVESTVRDAFYRDFNVFVPREATCSFFEPAEEAAIENFRFAFARVPSMAEMSEQLA